MESCLNTTVSITPAEECNYSNSHSHSPPLSQLSPTSVLSTSPPHPVVVSPCAACKILRRRCTEKCMLAPYFPPTDPHKFTIAHRVFGASNIIKLLQVNFIFKSTTIYTARKFR
ncbi:putative transcription factor AS2-LOB family [Helianthus annuus]|nr:putative transcription factor AS2-LOB family [Helianthus annuus]KAJ0718615.1 putative transcription factor AS2-LOB family [Helianthus annuus]